MQIKLFNIPIGADDGVVEEMNHFLRAHKIIDIKRELVFVYYENFLGIRNSCQFFAMRKMKMHEELP